MEACIATFFLPMSIVSNAAGGTSATNAASAAAGAASGGGHRALNLRNRQNHCFES